MAVRSYIVTKYISGLSAEDVQMEVHQMVEHGEFFIEFPVRSIASDMFHNLEDYVDPRYEKEDVQRFLDGPGGLCEMDAFTSDPSLPVRKVMLSSDHESRSYHYDVRGRFRARMVYCVSVIDDLDVAYLVSEHTVHPESGTMLRERCYHEYFRDLRAAMRYRDEKMKRYVRESGDESSGWRLLVVDANEMERNSWYKGNISAAADIKRYNLDPNDYKHIGDVPTLKEMIRADAYDELDSDDQDEVNYNIYNMIRGFISADYLMYMDEDIDSAGPGEFEGIIDTAIILALVESESAEDMEKVKSALGPYAWRIASLTDNLYNAHPDEGFIMVSESGDMGWYNNVYYINEWEGNSDSEWFGKFQPNENDTLLCFREFHPELIANRLPKPAELRALEKKYLDTISAERALHDEMSFDTYQDDDGKDVDVCVGTWYCDGLTGKKSYCDVHFPVEYGSYRFTPDECKRLLSGEEVVIEKFMSKVGREITVRGMLKDCSTMYDQELNLQYTRTDISNTARRRMDMDFGISDASEPGLPTEGGTEGI